MRAKVVTDHPGEGTFPTFKQGTPVTMDTDEDTDFPGWYACKIEGYATYVPVVFVRDSALTRDYNPTELAQVAGDMLDVNGIVNAWLIATNEQGTTGWIPAACVVSVKLPYPPRQGRSRYLA